MSPLSLLPSDAAAVGVGAVFGALARYHAGRAAAEWIAQQPATRQRWTGWHTAGINVAGSFILGGVTGMPAAAKPPTKAASAVAVFLPPRQKLLMGVGFCGSFTTFSTFSVEVAQWMMKGQLAKAAAYVVTNNVGGVAAAATGLFIVKKLLG